MPGQLPLGSHLPPSQLTRQLAWDSAEVSTSRDDKHEKNKRLLEDLRLAVRRPQLAGRPRPTVPQPSPLNLQEYADEMVRLAAAEPGLWGGWQHHDGLRSVRSLPADVGADGSQPEENQCDVEADKEPNMRRERRVSGLKRVRVSELIERVTSDLVRKRFKTGSNSAGQSDRNLAAKTSRKNGDLPSKERGEASRDMVGDLESILMDDDQMAALEEIEESLRTANSGSQAAVVNRSLTPTVRPPPVSLTEGRPPAGAHSHGPTEGTEKKRGSKKKRTEWRMEDVLAEVNNEAPLGAVEGSLNLNNGTEALLPNHLKVHLGFQPFRLFLAWRVEEPHIVFLFFV